MSTTHSSLDPPLALSGKQSCFSCFIPNVFVLTTVYDDTICIVSDEPPKVLSFELAGQTPTKKQTSKRYWLFT